MAGPDERHRPRTLVWAGLRGLATGAVSIASGLALAFLVVPDSEPEPCTGDEVACLPDFGAIFAFLGLIALIIMVLSPLVAWLLRLPRPLLYLLAAAWVGPVLFVAIGVHPVVQAILALVPYVLLALWTARARPVPTATSQV